MIRTPRQLATMTLVLLALSTVIILLLSHELPGLKAMKASEDRWSLNQLVNIESDAALSIINQRRLWGGAAGAAASTDPGTEKALTPPDWRIAGVFVDGGERVLVVSTVGQALPGILRVGDKLPGGAKILAISSDRITLSLSGKRLSLSTYQQ